MHIYIPSRGRADLISRRILSQMSPSALTRTTVVTHPSELQEYTDKLSDRVTVSCVTYDNIAQKRHQIGILAQSSGHDKFVMVDDDVQILVRESEVDWRLVAATPEQVDTMLEIVESQLDTYVSVALSGREGNNRCGEGRWSAPNMQNVCARAMRFTAYRTGDFLSVEHNRVPVMEDMDVTLQLLRSGRKNIVLSYWATGQRQTNEAGGCSLWRTRELHNAAAERLAELHPQFVKTRQKVNKTDTAGLGTRTEVTVRWKDAYLSSGGDL